VTPTKRRWKALAEAVWFPVISDGFASNVGVGASDETTMAATLATSGAMRVFVDADPRTIPSGLWCYRVGRAQWLLGGAVNDVGRANSWLRGTLDLAGSAAPDDILAAPPQPHTPVVLPFLTGERSTGWVSDARAVLSGVSVATSASSLYRGTMEGVAVSYARIAEQLIQVAPTATRVVASGRVAREVPGLLSLLADVLDIPVEPVLVKRSTLRGTAVMALQSLAPDVRREPPTGARTRRPRRHDAV
jgi:gluconokinase